VEKLLNSGHLKLLSLYINVCWRTMKTMFSHHLLYWHFIVYKGTLYILVIQQCTRMNILLNTLLHTITYLDV